MHLNIVVAIAEDGAIGRNGTLPWRIPGDLKYFKAVTIGKPVIMGRNTWVSLNGKPLKDRFNIVLSSKTLDLPEGVLLCDSLDKAIAAVETEGFQACSVIGGASLFAESVPRANTMHITRVHTRVPDADTFFPEIDMTPFELAWEEAHQADEKNQHAYTFQRWDRRAG